MKVMSELRLKLFANDIGSQARRIATPSEQIYGRVPETSLGQSVLKSPRPAGKDLAGCSLATLKRLEDYTVTREYFL